MLEEKQGKANILLLDSAYAGLMVGLSCPAGLICEYASSLHEQASQILPLIDAVLRQGNTEKTDLDMIAVTTGPGSFTGVRIGLSVAKALSFALDIPVAGVSCFDVIAYDMCRQNHNKDAFCVLIDSKRPDPYFRLYNSEGEPISQPQAAEIEDITKKETKIFSGSDVFEKHGGFQPFIPYNALPETSFADLAQNIFENGKFEKPCPLYISGAKISEAKKKQRYLS